MAVVQDNKSTKIVSLTATLADVVAGSFCRRIRVQENYSSATGPTTDLGMVAPKGADEIIILKGTTAVFTAGGGPNGCFSPGEVVGQIEVLDVAGPVEGQQIEDQLV